MGRRPYSDQQWLGMVIVRGPEECWGWTGHHSVDGYAKKSAHVDGESSVTRWLWKRDGREIPDGYELDHLCRNRGCVNLTHLECVTKKDNILRGDSFTARKARQTHCSEGHPLFGDNLKIETNGARRCRECARARSREYRARRKAQRG